MATTISAPFGTLPHYLQQRVHNGRIIVFMENGSAWARAADGPWAPYEGAAAVGPPVFGLLAPQHYISESVLLG